MTELQNKIAKMQARGIFYLKNIPENKLQDALDYLVALLPPSDEDSEGATLADDFDYELSQRADEALANGEFDFISFEEALAKSDLTIKDLEKADVDV